MTLFSPLRHLSDVMTSHFGLGFVHSAASFYLLVFNVMFRMIRDRFLDFKRCLGYLLDLRELQKKCVG